MSGWPISPVEPIAAARRGAQWSGTAMLRELSGLAGRLAALPAGERPEEVRWWVRFVPMPEAASTVVVEVAIEGAAWLICQRSLKPYSQVLAGRSRVALVASDAAAAALAPDLEPWHLAPGEMLDLRSLVSEEVLLALPLVPRAGEPPPAAAGCRPAAGDALTHRPFAVLADIRHKV